LAVFAATGLARDLLACVFAASDSGARSSGTNNAQNTMSDTVAFMLFILVDRSGCAIPAMKWQGFPPKPGLRDEAGYTSLPNSTMSEKIRRKDDWKGRSNHLQATVKSMKMCV
jgi:hypothetical protein